MLRALVDYTKSVVIDTYYWIVAYIIVFGGALLDRIKGVFK